MNAQARSQLKAKFEALSALEDGWFEGRGLAPDKTQLSLIEAMFVAHYPDLRLPMIVPTPEGNLLLEWDAPGSPSVGLEITVWRAESRLRAEFEVLAPDRNYIAAKFNLKTERDWRAFFDFLAAHVSSGESSDVVASASSFKRNGPPGSVGFQPCSNARVMASATCEGTTATLVSA